MTHYNRISLAARLGVALLAVASSGCASLKTMTADFERRWDDPKSILEEMEATQNKNRAADSSAAQMAAINSGDCIAKHGLLDVKSFDDAVALEKGVLAGECLLESGRDEEASKLFAKLSLSASSAVARQGEGVALVRLGRHEEAVTALNAAIELDPGLWRSWNALGVALDNLGKAEEAWPAFEKAAALNPSEGAPFNNLGVSLVKAGKHAEAVEALNAAMARDGARQSAEANLRLAYALEGDYAGAVKALPDERRAVALNNAGVAAASRGDKEEARRLFLKALEVSPHFYAKAYQNLTLLLE